MKRRNAARRRSVAGLRASAPVVAPHAGPGAPPSALAPSRPRGPRCPKCDMQTQLRARGKDGRPFWGCSRYPYCSGSISIDAKPEARATPPTIAPLLESIGRYTHRVFAAELVRRTREGQAYDEIVLGAMRTAFPKNRRIGDDAVRQRGLALALEPRIYDVVRALLDAQP